MAALSPALRTILLSGVRFLVRDTFTRADSALTLGNAEIGGAWTDGDSDDTSGPVFGVASGRAYRESGAGLDLYSYQETGRADCTIEADIDIDTSASSALHGLLFRRVSTGNYWAARVQNSTNQLSLLLNNGGARSAAATVALSLADGQTIRMRVTLIGQLILVYVDGTLLITHSSEVHVAGTQHGLYTSASTVVRWDNFGAWTGP